MNHLPARGFRVLISALLVVLALPAAAPSTPPPHRAIVAVEDGAASARVLAKIEKLGGEKVKDLPMVGSVVVNLPSKAAEKSVAAIAGVKYVEPDFVAHALARKGGTVVQPAEVLPWGISRIQAPSVWTSYTADTVKVAVVDTGIDVAHPDLLDNLKGGMSAVSYTASYTDDNGHGTHVAGTIAGVDNEIGVLGVAPKADLYSVKVLNRQGSGYLSDIIEGLEWAVANDIDVVNMSLGTSSYSATFESAVDKTVAAGVVVVAAAGNSGPGANTVEYPGKFDGVIAVGATDSSNNVAYFSSRGSQVDLAAPGASIFSTYKKGSYATMSGTSMASPHVAGTAALILSSPIGTDDIDADGVWDPNEVERRLERTAQDLGAAGFDADYGNGMVRANLAVVP